VAATFISGVYGQKPPYRDKKLSVCLCVFVRLPPMLGGINGMDERLINFRAA
jgi:hypothetical protein